jgi:flagellar hook-length control protein FliK
MADLQLSPVTPAASVGDFAASKLTESADGESFGQALSQAKTTISEKKPSRGGQEKESAKRAEQSQKKASGASAKRQKGAAADAQKLPGSGSAEAKISKHEKNEIKAEVTEQIKKPNDKFTPIPKATDNQADAHASEAVKPPTGLDLSKQSAEKSVSQPIVNNEPLELPTVEQQTVKAEAVELPTGPIEPRTEQQTARPGLTELLLNSRQTVNPDIENALNIEAGSALDGDAQTETVSSVLNERQQGAVPEKLTNTANSGEQNIENASDGRNANFADEALKTSRHRAEQSAEQSAEQIAEQNAKHRAKQSAEHRAKQSAEQKTEQITEDSAKQIAEKNRAANTAISTDKAKSAAADKSRASKQSKATDLMTDKKPNLTATANQQLSRQRADGMSLGEVKEALPDITNIEVSGDAEQDAGLQSHTQKEPAQIIAPQSAPLVIESALAGANSDEVKTAARKTAADKTTTKTQADESHTHSSKAHADKADTKTRIKAEKTDQTATAVKTESASVKSSGIPQTGNQAGTQTGSQTGTQSGTQSGTSPVESASKASSNAAQVAAAQAETDESASKAAEAAEAADASAEAKRAGVKTERTAANNKPEPTAQAGKAQHVSSNTGMAVQEGRQQSGAQSDTYQNQPQNTEEADEIKNAQSVKNSETQEFKAKFNSAVSAGTHSRQVTEAKTASSNTVPASHAENMFTPTNASVPVSATAQPTAKAARPFLPAQAPMAQLEGSVRWLLRTDTKGAEIQLHPENLGRVTVSLRIEGAEVHARVWATEASTMPLLENHKTFLESSLKEQGLTLSSFDLQHGKNGQQTNSNAQNHHQHFAPPMMESWTGTEFRQELPAQLTAQHADDGRVELYA